MDLQVKYVEALYIEEGASVVVVDIVGEEAGEE